MKIPSPQPLSRKAGEGLKKFSAGVVDIRVGPFLFPLARFAGEGVRG